MATKDYFYKIPIRDAGHYSNSIRTDPDGNVRDMQSPDEVLKRRKNIDYIDDTILALRGPKQILLDLGAGYCTAGSFRCISKYIAVDSTLTPTTASTDLSIIPSNDPNPSLNCLDIESNIDTICSLASDCTVALLHHVIEHLKSPDAFLRKLVSACSKGTLIIVGTPDFDSYAARIYGNKFRLLHDPTHISLFSRDSLSRLLRDIGLRILDIHTPYESACTEADQTIRHFHDSLSGSDVSPPFPGNIFTVYAEKI